MIRSTWDYVERLPAFAAWLERLESDRVRVFNPVSQLRANLRKDYLRDLESRGIPIVPSVWIDPDSNVTLKSVLASLRWPADEVVVKPRIGAGGKHTYRIPRTAFSDFSPESWSELMKFGGALIQPFLPEVLNEGEWSLLFFGGEYSHAVIKTSRAGEFRIQEEFGGVIREAIPTRALTDFALRVVQNSGAVGGSSEVPLYARVDLLISSGRPLLGELELLEPSFYFDRFPKGAARFSAALEARLVGSIS